MGQRKRGSDDGGWRKLLTAARSYRAERNVLDLLHFECDEDGQARGPQEFVDKSLTALFLQPTVDYLAVIVRDAETGRLSTWTSQRRRGDRPVADPEFSITVIQRVLETGRGWYVNDARDDPALADSASVPALLLRTIHAAPLRARLDEPPYGVLLLDNRHETDAFKTGWIRCVDELARRLGPRIEAVRRRGRDRVTRTAVARRG